MVYIFERTSKTKLKLNESTKRNAWLSLPDTLPCWSNVNEDCDVPCRKRHFVLLPASPLNFSNHGAPSESEVIPHGLRWFKPLCTMIERGDSTRPAVVQTMVHHDRAR